MLPRHHFFYVDTTQPSARGLQTVHSPDFGDFQHCHWAHTALFVSSSCPQRHPGPPTLSSFQPVTTEGLHSGHGSSLQVSETFSLNMLNRDSPVEICSSISAQTMIPSLVRCLTFILAQHYEECGVG